MRASARGESASQTFRVTVATSTQWGIIGVGIIGVALLVLVRCGGEVRTPMNADKVIEAQNLTKRYDGVPVVKGISFSVARGEIFGLLGPNGAGKTTTILMMLGLTRNLGRAGARARIRSGARAACRSSGGSAICRTRSASMTT